MFGIIYKRKLRYKEFVGGCWQAALYVAVELSWPIMLSTLPNIIMQDLVLVAPINNAKYRKKCNILNNVT